MRSKLFPLPNWEVTNLLQWMRPKLFSLLNWEITNLLQWMRSKLFSLLNWEIVKLNTKTVYTLSQRTTACSRHPDPLSIYRTGCSPQMKVVLWWEGVGLQNMFWITFDCSGWGQSCMTINGYPILKLLPTTTAFHLHCIHWLYSPAFPTGIFWMA